MSCLRLHLSSCIRRRSSSISRAAILKSLFLTSKDKLGGDDVAYTRTLQKQKHKIRCKNSWDFRINSRFLNSTKISLFQSRRHPRLRLRLETIAPSLLQPSPATWSVVAGEITWILAHVQLLLSALEEGDKQKDDGHERVMSGSNIYLYPTTIASI